MGLPQINFLFSDAQALKVWIDFNPLCFRLLLQNFPESDQEQRSSHFRCFSSAKDVAWDVDSVCGNPPS